MAFLKNPSITLKLLLVSVIPSIGLIYLYNSGFDALDIPAIAVTAGAMKVDDNECLKAGVYIPIPIELKKYISTMATWL